MIARASSPFPRRHNLDGSIDSICACCFLTVASACAERVLDQTERAHICTGMIGIAHEAVRLAQKEGRPCADAP